jgi:hypothetical protein
LTYEVKGIRYGKGGVMGRKVSNIYGTTANPDVMTLEITSNGIYSIEIVFDMWMYDSMKERSWCFEQTKGLVYTMDLSMELPTQMGYSTARVYLRDFIMYNSGMWGRHKPSHTWPRSLENYVLRKEDLIPIG